MDIDFHFGTIYVLSRWAGFSGDEATIIATSSQFVDDNISKDPNSVESATESCDFGNGTKRLSGHDMLENLSEAGDRQVWIPFHFLPGLRGDTQEEKLVCHKQSSLAKLMVEAALDNHGDNRLFRLGITLHVYADTWSHQEFSGITDKGNIVNDVRAMGENSVDKLEDDILDIPLAIRPLGHASAFHWPDRPYVSWSSENKFSDGRNNWDEFLEASREIYNVLQQARGRSSNSFTEFMEKILTNTFQSIQNIDCNARNDEWVRQIRMKNFAFADHSEIDDNIGYDKAFITDTDNQRLFYSAIDEHYEFVKNSLHNSGVNILES